MATKKQTAANRRNARHSTGPKTAAGKATASMNALKHGLRAQTVVLRSEHQEDFDEIHAGLQNQYLPQNASEQHLVDQAAIAQWKLVRAENVENQCFEEKDMPPKELAAMFDRMTQIESRLERAFFRAYKELERLQAARQKHTEPPQPPQPPQPSKGGKAKDNTPPPRLEVAWVDPTTGEKEVFYRAENGEKVDQFSTPPSPRQP